MTSGSRGFKGASTDDSVTPSGAIENSIRLANVSVPLGRAPKLDRYLYVPVAFIDLVWRRKCQWLRVPSWLMES